MKSIFLKQSIAAAFAVFASSITFSQPTVTVSSGSTANASAPLGAAVNPMTGQSLTHEQLVRELARARLTTEFKQELLKQAQTDADLAIQTLRLKVEEQALKEKMTPTRASQPANAAASGAAPRSATSGTPSNTAQRSPQIPAPSIAMTPGAMPVAAPSSAQPVQPAKGTISIGGETLSVAGLTAASPSVARVESVDAQAKPPGDLFGASGAANALSNLGIGLPRPGAAQPVVIPPLKVQ